MCIRDRGHTTAFLEDYKSFTNNPIKTADTQNTWPNHHLYNSISLNDDLKKYHLERKTVAYLVFKNDSILFEKYYDGFNKSSKSNSFSMVKSIVSALMGIAIQERYIKSLDQKVIDFIPDLKGPFAHQVSIGDLSSMASGQEWSEEYYNPFSVTSASYFVENLNKLIMEQPITSEPGKAFKYQSGTTQLLAMVIKKATGLSISEYLSEKLWKPLGAEQPGYITVDRFGAPRSAGGKCFTTRDLARVGMMIYQNGSGHSQQIVPESWIEDIFNNGNNSAWDLGDMAPDFPNKNVAYRSKWYSHKGSNPMIHGIGTVSYTHLTLPTKA